MLTYIIGCIGSIIVGFQIGKYLEHKKSISQSVDWLISIAENEEAYTEFMLNMRQLKQDINKQTQTETNNEN